MTLLLFILILSILVFVHEFGHFWAAKKAGIKVEEFGFGLPPRIWSKKVRGTIYSINALPIGGFVRLYGEDGSEKEIKNKNEKIKNNGKAYFEASLARRLSVLFAGVIMNLVLAIVCFSILYFFLGIPTKTGRVKIEGVTENSPAQEAKLMIGDEIITVNGAALKKTEDFISISKQNAGKLMELEIKREEDNPCKEKVLGGMAGESGGLEGQGGGVVQCRGENLLLSLIPRGNPPAGEGPLGVVISDTEMKKYPFYIMPFLGVREGFKESWAWGKEIYFSMKKMLAQLIFQGKVPKDIAGPIGIFQITGQAAKQGVLAVFQFVGILSVNLAMMNVLPLPALDGGRVVFLAYEVIARKKAPAKLEMLVNNIGMLVLLMLMLLITVNDVMRLVSK